MEHVLDCSHTGIEVGWYGFGPEAYQKPPVVAGVKTTREVGVPNELHGRIQHVEFKSTSRLSNVAVPTKTNGAEEAAMNGDIALDFGSPSEVAGIGPNRARTCTAGPGKILLEKAGHDDHELPTVDEGTT